MEKDLSSLRDACRRQILSSLHASFVAEGEVKDVADNLQPKSCPFSQYDALKQASTCAHRAVDFREAFGHALNYVYSANGVMGPYAIFIGQVASRACQVGAMSGTKRSSIDAGL